MKTRNHKEKCKYNAMSKYEVDEEDVLGKQLILDYDYCDWQFSGE